MRALALYAIALASCDAHDPRHAGVDSATTVDTTNGVIITKNGTSGLWTPGERWTVTEQFRLGSADGPAETTFRGPIASVSIGPAGNIYVLESQTPVIKVFDRNGTFLRTFGRAGAGPGELRAPRAMGWDTMQRLWIAHAFDGRYTVFDTAGTFIKTVPRAARQQPRIQYALFFDGSGTLVDETAGGVSVSFFRVDTAGTVLDSMAPLSTLGYGYTDRILPPDFDRTFLGYRSTPIWNLAPDGSLWFAESGILRYVQRTLSGDTLRIIEASHRDASVDSDRRNAIERELAKIGLDPSDYRIARPLNQSLHVLHDGHLLVQIGDDIGVDGRVFDVYDPDGRFLGPLDFGFRISTRSVPAFVGDTIVAIAIGDEFDIPYLIRATIIRPGT